LGTPVSKFYRWLAYPHLSPYERRHLPRVKVPEVLKQVHTIGRPADHKTYTKEEIWYDEDNVYFYKYCNHNLRLKFYHALGMNAGGNPEEFLALKIKDMRIVKDHDGNPFVPLNIGRYSKRKADRPVGASATAIAYFREYQLKEHPDGNNPNAYLFASREHSAKNSGKSVPISVNALEMDYRYYKNRRIPALLKSPDSEVSPEDKKMLKYLEETKKWFPYIQRHSSVSRARKKRIDDSAVKGYYGWTSNSQMLNRYNHPDENDGFERVMLALGINVNTTSKEDMQKREKLLEEARPRKCPFCEMVNVKEARFYTDCKMPLDPMADMERRQEAENMKKELEKIKSQIPAINRNFATLLMGVMEKLGEGKEFEFEQPDGSGEKIILGKSYPAQYNFGLLDGSDLEWNEEEKARQFEEIKEKSWRRRAIAKLKANGFLDKVTNTISSPIV
jgi:hypothetical protein